MSAYSDMHAVVWCVFEDYPGLPRLELVDKAVRELVSSYPDGDRLMLVDLGFVFCDMWFRDCGEPELSSEEKIIVRLWNDAE